MQWRHLSKLMRKKANSNFLLYLLRKETSESMKDAEMAKAEIMALEEKLMWRMKRKS